MRRFFICLTLVIAVLNAISVAQADADNINEQHHAGMAIPDEHGTEHDHGLLAHHCCHTHAHVFLLSDLESTVAKIDNPVWFQTGGPSPLLMGFAPPIPPPKA